MLKRHEQGVDRCIHDGLAVSIEEASRQVSTEELATTSSPTLHFSCPFEGTATRRKPVVPTASPTLGAVGSWRSSDSIHFLSRNSISRSAFWTLGCISSDHSCKYFSCTLLPTGPSIMFVSLRLNSCANFSSVVCLWLGCHLKSSHASSYFSWRRCVSSARKRQ